MNVPNVEIYEIAKLPNPVAVAKYWKRNGRVLDRFRYIHAFDLKTQFLSIPSLSVPCMPDHIRCLYDGNRMYMYDSDIIQNLCSYKPTTKTIGYSFILDTNAASYIKSFVRGKKHNKSDSVEKVIFYLKEYNLYFDYLFYIIENFRSLSVNETAVKSNIRCLEIVRTMDVDLFRKEGLVTSTRPDDELDMLVQEQIDNTIKSSKFKSAMPYMERINDICYLILLKALVIGREDSNIKDKLKNLIHFMHFELSCIFERELLLAIEFALNKFKCGFFEKVNDGAKDVLGKLRNMAWDLTLLRYLEEVTQTDMFDFTVPFVVSYDEELMKLTNMYPVRSILIDKETGTSFTRPSVDILGILLKHFEPTDLEQFFSEKAAVERQKRMDGYMELGPLIQPLEAEVRGMYP